VSYVYIQHTTDTSTNYWTRWA